MIEKFKKIFNGLDIAYGQTKKTDEYTEKGKHKTKSFTVAQPPTDSLWRDHLEGKDPALGIIPIRRDNTTIWGCIDWDIYPLDHKQISLDLAKRNFPLTPLRSKSGGAHLFLFTSVPVPAKLMREKLKIMASELGLAKAEIFPKQDSIRVDRGDTGSFLNLPYHNDKNTVRYAFSKTGESLSIEEFFNHYDEVVLTDQQLREFKIKRPEANNDFEEMPPCLIVLLEMGVTEGMRNDCMYNVGVYLKKRYPENNKWQTKMNEYNIKYFKPPIESTELEKTKVSVSNKDYNYKCKQPPIEAHCDSKTCVTRKYGVGDDAPAPEIKQIRKYDSDPPMYFVDIDGQSVEVDAKTLHDAESFSVACLEQIGQPMMPVAKIIWRKMLRKLFSELGETVKAPESTKLFTQLKELLADFINKTPGKELKDILRGISYNDENDITYFKFESFWKYLLRNKWADKTYPRQKTIRLLQQHFDVKEAFPKINEKTVPSFSLKKINLDRPPPTTTKLEDNPWQ